MSTSLMSMFMNEMIMMMLISLHCTDAVLEGSDGEELYEPMSDVEWYYDVVILQCRNATCNECNGADPILKSAGRDSISTQMLQ